MHCFIFKKVPSPFKSPHYTSMLVACRFLESKNLQNSFLKELVVKLKGPLYDQISSLAVFRFLSYV